MFVAKQAVKKFNLNLSKLKDYSKSSYVSLNINNADEDNNKFEKTCQSENFDCFDNYRKSIPVKTENSLNKPRSRNQANNYNSYNSLNFNNNKNNNKDILMKNSINFDKNKGKLIII